MMVGVFLEIINNNSQVLIYNIKLCIDNQFLLNSQNYKFILLTFLLMEQLVKFSVNHFSSCFISPSSKHAN